MKKLVILVVVPFLVMGSGLFGMTKTNVNLINKTSSTNKLSFLLVPASQASNLSLTNVQSTSMTASWTRGSGTGCAVFVKAGVTTGNQVPTNGTNYTGNSIYGSGTQIAATGWYCVYQGAGNTVNITGLTAGTNYRVEVYEYDGVYSFNTTIASNNLANRPLTPATQALNLVFTNVQSNAMTVAWTRGNGSNCAVFVYQGTSGTPTTANNTTYIANNSYGTGSQAGAGWYCVYNGTGTTVTINNLTAGNDYRVMVIEYNGVPGGEQYFGSTSTNNPLNKPVAPTTQASNILFTNVQNTSMVLSWTRGNGSKCAVFVFQGNVGTALPTNNTTYTANTTFGSGTQAGTGWYCVYNGVASTVTVTGLTAGNDYRVMVVEYNGTTGGEQYLSTASTNNPLNKPVVPSVQASNIVLTNVSGTQMNVSWTRGNGENCAVFVKVASTGNAAPVNNTSYTANANYGSGSQGGTGWYCVYKGTGTSVNVTGMTAGTSYRVMVVEYNGNAGGEQYNTNSATNNPFNKPLTPTTQATNLVYSNVTPTAMTLSWTRGTGNNCAVFVYQGTTGTPAMVNNTTYTANPVMGNGTQAGAGWYCVYNGNLSTVTITGLTPGLDYRTMVIEYNGTTAGEQYIASTATNNPLNKPSTPGTQANGINFATVLPTSMVVKWTRGNGSNCVVFVTQNNTGTASPSDNTTYTANASFGSGSQIGTSGWYCVYKGTGTSVTVSNLIANNDYRVMVCEYNGTALGELYNSNTATNNPLNKPVSPITQATNIIFNNVLSNQMDISWTRGNGENNAVFIKLTNTGSPSPANNTTYTANSVYGSGSQAGTGWYCIYKGSGTNVTVTNLSALSTYQVMVVEYNGNLLAEQYLTSSSTNNPLAQKTLPSQSNNIVFSNIMPTSLNIAWSNGNGGNRVVFVKQTSIIESASPVNNITYTPSTTFGNGSQIGTGWYCVYNSTSNNVNVYGLTPGITYRVMVCEYSGTAGTEQYNISNAVINPSSFQTTLQASNIVFTNVLANSMDVAWSRGSGSGCVVFVKAGVASGNATPVNNVTYNSNPVYGSGDNDGLGWYCVYKGTGNSVSVSNLIAGTNYRVMVCEYTGTAGNEQYNTGVSTNNPANKPAIPATPTTQANNIVFSNVLSISCSVSWTNGNGSGRAVFVKQTSAIENAVPANNSTYSPNTTFGSGNQISSSGWYCVYNGTGTSVNILGLTPGISYRVMVCEYNGLKGFEQYNINSAVVNPSSVLMNNQASNLVFTNVLANSMDISWSRGSGGNCLVFVKGGVTSGNANPLNNVSYNPNTIYGSGDNDGTGWYCVYNGTGTAVSVTGLVAGTNYRVMVCEYSGTPGAEQYNSSTTSYNNPANKPAIPSVPTTQANTINFSTILAGSMNVTWSNGNGSYRAVFIKQTIGNETATPVNSTTYTANTTFGTGAQIGTSGFYCIYNGTGSSINVYGLTPGSTYRVMVCEYNGSSGSEQYNTSSASLNPFSTNVILQAGNVVFSNILATSMDISWNRGLGTGCIVFLKATSTGNAAPTNNITYYPNSIFGSGDQDGNGWFSVYKGTGNTVNVTNLVAGTTYRAMVCEYTGAPGAEQYNTGAGTNNPMNKSGTTTPPNTQAYNLTFTNTLTNSMTVNWTNGNGTTRAVFIKQTTAYESVLPVNNTTYLASANFGSGSQVGSTGWYCIYNGTGSSVNILGLTLGQTYRVMVCEYSGVAGNELYNTDLASNNPSSNLLSFQSGNLAFNNVMPTTMDLSWIRGSGTGCVVFVKQTTSGSPTLTSGATYTGNTLFGNGSPDGSGWFCVYKGAGTSVSVSGLSAGKDYRVMVCEYAGIPGSENYNLSTSTGNIGNKPITPTSQSNNVNFTNVTTNSMTVSWSNGNGSSRAVFIKQTTALDKAIPADNTTYLPNTIYGSGSQIGLTGWYCIYTGTGSSVSITGLTAGNTYRTMVCEYNGSAGNELYDIDQAIGNPASIPLVLQANSINFSNLQSTSMNLSWSRGGGANCIVFIKQTNSGVPSPANNIIYTDNTQYGAGSTEGTGWYCIYKGTGTSVSVTGLIPNKDYRVMVLEYNGSAGSEQYITCTASGNPANRTLSPTSQASSISFSTVTSNSMVINWSNGNGAKRAVFVKQTNLIESASPANNSTYNSNTVFGSGNQIGSSGWFCVYNNNGSSVTVTGLTTGQTYRVMVCEYNGSTGTEFYNTDLNAGNPASIPLINQASNIVFTNVLPNSMDVSWSRGSGTNCIVFVKQTNSGNSQPANGISYTANPAFGVGSPDGSGWYCIYNGTGTTVSLTGLTANKDYRVMVCEYTGTSGNELYNLSTSTGNPASRPLAPTTQSSNIVFSNTTNNSVTVAWTGGNGSSRVVFVKQTTALVNALPVNKTTYTANSVFGSGTQIGSTGWYCAYNGTSTSFTLSGLTAGNTYRIEVCDYNGTSGNELYNTDIVAGNPSSLPLTLQAKSIVFTAVLPTSMNLNWIRGSGSGCLVFVKQTTSGNASPVNTITYTANSVFGNGSTDGNGWYCVYKGTGTSTTVTGLTANKDYRVMVCEYTGTPGNELYNSSTALVNPANNTVKPTNPATNITFNNTYITKTNINWTRGNGQACAVFMKQTSSTIETSVPVNNTTYTDNGAFGIGNQIDASGWYCIYNGTGNTTLVTGLTGGTTYRVMVCEYNGILGSEQFNILATLNNPANVTTTTTKSDQTITFSPLSNKQFGSADYLPGGTASSGLTIVYTSSNPLVATIIGGYIHIVGMGITSITATQPGDSNYNPATNVSQSLTVEKGTQGINFYPLPTKNLGDPDFDPGAVASSGLPVIYSSDNPSVATIVNNKIHIVGVGKTSIGASQEGNTNFYAASNVYQSFIVDKSSQTITFNAMVGVSYEDADFDPLATASSGLLVTYSSSNPSVATIIGGRVHITGAGTTTIEAMQTGNFNYYPAMNVPQILTINKSDQTITFGTIPSMVYTDVYLEPATTSSNLAIVYTSSDTTVAKIEFGKVHVVGGGITTITANQPGNTNYNAAIGKSQVLTVTKTTQTISFDPLPSFIYGDPDYLPVVTSTSGLSITLVSDNPAVATIIGGKIHLIGQGTANITASQPGSATYFPATSVVQSLSVTESTQSIYFWSLPSKTFGDPDFNLSATASSGLTVSFTSDNPAIATITGTLVHILKPGTVNITASQAGNAEFGRAPYVIQPLTIDKADQTILLGVIPSVTYGAADFDPNATATSGLPVNYISDNTNIATIVNGKVHILAAGTVNILAEQPGNTFYNPASLVSQSLTINKAAQSLIFGALPVKTYNDADFDPGATASTGLPVSYTSSNQAVAVIIDGKIHIMGVGTTTITAYQTGNGNYSAAVAIAQTLTVNKALQFITFNSLPTKAFGDPDFNLTATSSAGLEVSFSSSNPTVATVVNGRVHILNSGTTIISANQAGDGNFLSASTKNQTLVVTKATQSIDFVAFPAVAFGDEDFVIDASASSGLPLTFTSSNSLVATTVNGWIHIIGAGSTLITASQTGNSNYNPASNVLQVLVIGKADQEIFFDLVPDRIYGDTDFDPGAITSSGLQVNYISSNNGVATIVNGKIHIVGAGTTTITGIQTGNSNYSAAIAVSQPFNVSKATLTATADNASRKYNVENPAFTCSYDGFLNGDDASMIDQKPTVITIATVSSDPGKYDLIPQNGLDNNYDFIYVKGQLFILGTTPLKPSKPYGKDLLCINSPNQSYSTAGGVFATNYVWEIYPSSAGTISGIDKIATVNFNDTYTGLVSIVVKGKNTNGISDASDTLHVRILPVPSAVNVSFRGRYCSNNLFGDSISIVNPQPWYEFQLYESDNPVGNVLPSTGQKLTWYDLKADTYSITEAVCNVSMAKDLIIKEIQPTSSKPEIIIKWNDVLVCKNHADSIIAYQWYKNNVPISGENKQFLWTQQKTGNYSVKTTDDSGCEFSSDDLLLQPVTVGIVYPNPNHGQFKVSFTNTNTGDVTIRIANANSLPLKSYTYKKENDLFEQEISIPNLSAGVYFVDVWMNNTRVFYEKIVVE